jgi:hypothetical protein
MGDAEWIGYRALDLLRHPDPDAVQPIVIRADAFSDGVPRRDLRVSPEHAVLIEGRLIPARLLVNGASIERDTGMRATTYYHVELDTHDILLVENLPAESYLDTGNRGSFTNGGVPLRLHPRFDNDQAQRVAASCMPFTDDAANVEPIWHKLAMRAVCLGVRLPTECVTTRDPGLHVLAGRRWIKPISVDGQRYVFALPAGQGSVRLVSRSARPCDARPWVEDHRQLGVMVSRIVLRATTMAGPIALDHSRLSAGWWGVEHDDGAIQRGTNGHALIPLPGSVSGPALLEISVAGTLDYPLRQDAASGVGEAIDRTDAAAVAA